MPHCTSTQRTQPRVLTRHQSRRIPDTSQPIFTSRQDGLGVGAKRHAGHGLGVPQARPHRRCPCVRPKRGLCYPRGLGWCRALPSGLKATAVTASGWSRWKPMRFRGRGYPTGEDEAVLAGRGKIPAGGTEGHARNRPLMLQGGRPGACRCAASQETALACRAAVRIVLPVGAIGHGQVTASWDARMLHQSVAAYGDRREGGRCCLDYPSRIRLPSGLRPRR